jgi:hypothetical protein
MYTLQNNIKIASKSLENVAKFRYLETVVTNQNVIREEIESRLNMEITRYHSVSEPFVFSPAA